jgi:predicted nucleotidyltransferase
MSVPVLQSEQYTALTRIAADHGLEFIRLFGSGLHSVDKARDIDLVIDRIISELPRFSELVGELSKVFSKPIDLIELRRELPPLLVREIAQFSLPLWERPGTGRAKYAELIVPLMAIADDERLSLTPELRLESVRSVQKRLADGS